MKKVSFFTIIVLLVVLAGGIFFWNGAHRNSHLIDVPQDEKREGFHNILIGDTETGEVWEVEEDAEKLFLMNNWTKVSVKETGRFEGSFEKEAANYRFNVFIDKNGFGSDSEIFFLASPEKASNNQVEYETVSGDNMFTHIKEMINGNSYKLRASDKDGRAYLVGFPLWEVNGNEKE